MNRITLITKEDLAFIEKLEKELFSDPWSLSSLESWLSGCGGKGYLLWTDSVPCAYALFQSFAGEGELLRCGVAPEMRRKSLGFSLLSFALNEEKNAGIHRIFLEVRSQNIPAKNLYEKLGFSLLGKRNAYYQKPLDDALIYEKQLTE